MTLIWGLNSLTFSFAPNSTFELVGDYKPVNPLEKFDDTWDGKIKYFKKEALFTQKVKILALKFKIPTNIEGQVCSDKVGSCIPFEADLEINNYNLKITPAKIDSNKGEEKTDDETIGEKGILDEVKKEDLTNPKDETKIPAEKDTLVAEKPINDSGNSEVSKTFHRILQNQLGLWRYAFVEIPSIYLSGWIGCHFHALRFPHDSADGFFFHQ